MGKGALAFLAGLGSGYLNASKQREEKERQDKIDQIRFDEADRAKSEWALTEKKRKDIAEAAKDGGNVVDDAQVVTGLAAQPATYQDKDLAASDVREGNRMLRQAPASIAATNGVTQLSATPSAANAQAGTSMAGAQGVALRDPTVAPPSEQIQPVASQQGVTMAALGKPMFQGKEYADVASAKVAAQTYNSSDARNARIAEAMRSNGDHEGAMRMEANAKQAALQDFQMKVMQHDNAKKLKDEGVFDAAAALRRGDGAAVKAAFNSGGQHKIDGEVSITPLELDVKGLGKIPTYQATFNVIGPDGQPKQVSYNSHDLSMQLMPAEKALEWDMKVAQNAFDQKYKTDSFKEQVRSNKAQEGVAFARLAQDERHYQDSLPAGKIKLIEAAIKDYTMPEDKRKEMLGIDNLDQKTRLLVSSNLKESDQLQAAMNTAMAKGEWMPDSAGAKELRTRQAVLSESLRNLLSGSTAKKSGDPLGLYGGNTGGAGKPSPQPTADTTATKPSTKSANVPRASEYKGESDSEKLWGNVKSIASAVGSGIKKVGDNFDKIEKADQLRSVRGRIENNLSLTEAQKKIAIENGLLLKE